MATLQHTTGDEKRNTSEDHSLNAEQSEFLKFLKLETQDWTFENSTETSVASLKLKSCCLGFEPFHKTTKQDHPNALWEKALAKNTISARYAREGTRNRSTEIFGLEKISFLVFGSKK